MPKSAIFIPAMSAAILAGKKTQTRRFLTPPPPSGLVSPLQVGVFTPTRLANDGRTLEGFPTYGVFSEDGDWGVVADAKLTI
jgi:hypothetical protein